MISEDGSKARRKEVRGPDALMLLLGSCSHGLALSDLTRRRSFAA